MARTYTRSKNSSTAVTRASPCARSRSQDVFTLGSRSWSSPIGSLSPREMGSERAEDPPLYNNQIGNPAQPRNRRVGAFERDAGHHAQRDADAQRDRGEASSAS